MKTVLVIDDDVSVLEVMRRVLRLHDVDVLTAASGQEARELVRAGRVDCILIDVGMGESGPRIAEDLRSLAPHARIVFMSGHSKQTLDELGVCLGDSHFVPKPLSFAALEAALSIYPKA